jgi:cell division protein FtsB
MFGVMRSQMLLERLLPIAILVVAVVAVPAMILSPFGLRRLDALHQEREHAEEAVSHLSHEIRRLRAEVEQVRGQLSAVERVARDELGLVRRTEVVFQFDR